MRTLIMTVGEEAIFSAAGLTPIVMPSTSPSGAPSPIGFISYPSRAEGSLGVGLPFGRIEAEALSSLADLSERYGDGSLRTTPWRALLVPGIASANAEQITGDIRGLGLIADSADPRLHIFACVGAPSCQSASVDARADASHLAATIPATRDHTIHVSGCIKACAHRGPAALTLVGRDGRYDLVRNGSAADQPALTGLSIEQAVALLQSAKEQQRA